MNAQDLKNSILQLAIQGKLVEQREEEGSAEGLYEQIQVEKKELVKEGKIKKTKKTPEITQNEIPFDIPKSWKWVRISEVIDVRDGTHDTPKYVTEGVPLVTSKNLKNGEIDFDNVKLISFEDAEKINQRSGVKPGDILFAMIGSIGNPVLLRKSRNFAIKNMALFKAINTNLFNMEYLFWFLQLEQKFMKRKAAGGVQSFVSLTFLRNYLIPLPPFEEQGRIAAKIEELVPYVEEYDKAYSEVKELNTKFPEDMQKSILQYAIQGKLIYQREEEGTAEELYQHIQEEKKKLVEEGKIKKKKALPEISEDEIPFDIPESWKWVRLGTLCNYGNCNSISAINIPADGWLLDLQDIEKDSGEILNKKRMKDVNSTSSKHIFKKGDVLYSKLRPYLNKVVIADEDGYSTSEILPLDFGENIYNKYAQTVLMSPYFIDYAVGCSYGVKMPRLGTNDGQLAVFPLPPLEEQKRIVDKIEELLPYTKQLVK